jgi:hypothetical protein
MPVFFCLVRHVGNWVPVYKNKHDDQAETQHGRFDRWVISTTGRYSSTVAQLTFDGIDLIEDDDVHPFPPAPVTV